jgi:hypothetical protein
MRSRSGCRQSFKKQKVELSMKIILEVDIRFKNIPYEGTKAFSKGKKPGLFVNFGQFPCSWIRIRIRITYTDPDAGQPNQCGSGSTTLLWISSLDVFHLKEKKVHTTDRDVFKGCWRMKIVLQ